jgi:hypothetical protein
MTTTAPATPSTVHDRAGLAAVPPVNRRLVWALMIANLIAGWATTDAGVWDLVYHANTRVDSFFSPPHIAIYGKRAAPDDPGFGMVQELARLGRGTRHEWDAILIANKNIHVALSPLFRVRCSSRLFTSVVMFRSPSPFGYP